mgnify:CR=1 FL=1
MTAEKGTKEDPWKLKTPPLSSDYEMYKDEKDGTEVIVCVVGKTTLLYEYRCLADLHAMLKKHGDWMELGSADEQKPAKDGTVEAWRRLVHPDDRTSAHAGILRSLEDPTTASEFEYRIVRLDGAVRWIYAKVKTLCDAEGQAVRMVGVNLDITDRKEAQLRLERFAEELERQVTRRTQELVSSQDRLRTLATELNLAEQRERKRHPRELPHVFSFVYRVESDRNCLLEGIRVTPAERLGCRGVNPRAGAPV